MVKIKTNLVFDEGKTRSYRITVYQDFMKVYERTFFNGSAFQKKYDFIKDMVKSLEAGECTEEDFVEAL